VELTLLNPLLPCMGESLAEGLSVDLGCAVGCVKYVTPDLTKKELQFCDGLAAGGCRGLGVQLGWMRHPGTGGRGFFLGCLEPASLRGA
jgi:hypothetical protein